MPVESEHTRGVSWRRPAPQVILPPSRGVPKQEFHDRTVHGDHVQETSSGVPCHKVKESQTIWQKATSLRQSFRHSSSKYKVSQKASSASEHSLFGDSERGKGKLASFRREWGSQRNLSRERRSLAATATPKSREPNPSRRNARSLCVSGEWDIAPLEDMQPSASGPVASDPSPPSIDAIELPSRHLRSPRKLTKDSGYETSAQGDPDYINALDWPVEENPTDKNVSSDHRAKHRDSHASQDKENGRITSQHRLEWNSRHRPLSFSHQEVNTDTKLRNLRHSYSQREVSSTRVRDCPRTSSDLVKHSPLRSKQPYSRYSSAESVSTWGNPSSPVSKSVPLLSQSPHLHSSSSINSLPPSDTEDINVDNMVTRRFKKGSVYDALASTSGLDFAPVVQLKTYNSRREDQPTPHPKEIKLLSKSWDIPLDGVPKDSKGEKATHFANGEASLPNSGLPSYQESTQNQSRPSLPASHNYSHSSQICAKSSYTISSTHDSSYLNSVSSFNPTSSASLSQLNHPPCVRPTPSSLAITNSNRTSQNFSHGSPPSSQSVTHSKLQQLSSPPDPSPSHKLPSPVSSQSSFQSFSSHSHWSSSNQNNSEKRLPPPPPATNLCESKRDRPSSHLAAHEKYPSWPVTSVAPVPTTSYRSHSWTGHSDYPKEKVAYSRPKKSFKISTNQLQPVLERSFDSAPNKTQKRTAEPSLDITSAQSPKSCNEPTTSVAPTAFQDNGYNGETFDFDAFHTPCIPRCYGDKDYSIHSPPERDITASCSKDNEMSESNSFLSRYEDVLKHQAQYSVPLSNWNKQGLALQKIPSTPDTPLLDRLRLDIVATTSAWPSLPPPPVPPPPGSDVELSSEAGTWMGSMESSSHGRGVPKWQGSYSDLSTLSTQLSNRSSLFDSGHSTMPESGRLSPQSSCDSTAPSLGFEGPTRAQVVARHGCHREIVAHSARVQQPERHGSESVLYYATGIPSRPSTSASEDNSSCSVTVEKPFRPHESNTVPQDSSLSQISQTTLSVSSKSSKYPVPNEEKFSRENRKITHSLSLDESSTEFKGSRDNSSRSSSDVSDVACSLNYREAFNSSEENLIKSSCAEGEKKMRISDPELKAIQKQAVMSFYQRMSMAESVKNGAEPPSIRNLSDREPPPPYEATSPTKLKMCVPKLALLPDKYQQTFDDNPKDSRTCEKMSRGTDPHSAATGKSAVPPKTDPSSGLLSHHSKSVPNLVNLKSSTSQSFDSALPHTSQHLQLNEQHQLPYWNSNSENSHRKGSPLAKEEIIPWDQLPSVLEKKRVSSEKVALASENKDPADDSNNSNTASHYFKGHKSPRKAQLKEVHHSNETASVKVITPEGVTLVQTSDRTEHKEEKSKSPPPPPPPSNGVHHKRRPAPPPPPKQPPKRPPPPPPPPTPPSTPPPILIINGDTEDQEIQRIEESAARCPVISGSASSPQLLSYGLPSSDEPCCSSPELPLPPPPLDNSELEIISDEPLPPPPDLQDVELPIRTLSSASLVYPKDSYMSYRSERKLGRQGFDGNYRRSFYTSASSVDLTTLGSSFRESKDVLSPSTWEQMHNIRQHGTTVIFHSDCLHNGASQKLQRSTSQDCVISSEQAFDSDASNGCPTNGEQNLSLNSINSQGSDSIIQVEPVSVPPSQGNHPGTQTSSPIDFHCNVSDCSSQVSLESKCLDEVVINCETSSENFAENEILSGSPPDNSPDCNNKCVNIDSDINTLDNHESNTVDLNFINGNDITRTNTSTQTTDTPRLRRKNTKTKAELECERLSRDFIHHYGDATLRNLLVPAPNHKTMSDYMEGLLNLELEKGGHPVRRCHSIDGSPVKENGHWNENTRETKTLPITIESQQRHLNGCIESAENNNIKKIEIGKRKEELLSSIEKKLETLQAELKCVREEQVENEFLGQEVTGRVQQLAKPNELEKYALHVEEMEKIINLLLSLSSRLAKAENSLEKFPKDDASDEKRTLEAKRDKLRDQHEDARRLKESIDRRSNQVSTFLRRFLTDEEYTDYDHFIKMKVKLIVDTREIDEKIKLGEEQLSALRNNTDAHLWESANS